LLDALLFIPLIGAMALGWAAASFRGWLVSVLGFAAVMSPLVEATIVCVVVIRHEILKERLTAFQVNLALVLIGVPMCAGLFIMGRHFSRGSSTGH
jgi:hypothetical protein